MNLAVDVHYEAERATVAGVWFSAWEACEPDRELLTRASTVAAYAPGQFYKRELPCILSLLRQVESLPTCIVVDGYVYLGREKKPGLGKYLYDALSGETAVIGVAKSHFRGTPRVAEIRRGDSRRPLYVTAVGVSQEEAKWRIKGMCGENRIPLLLKRVDQLCRRA
jgi:deoxyribonuclease V